MGVYEITTDDGAVYQIETEDDSPALNQEPEFTPGEKFVGGITNLLPFNFGDEIAAGAAAARDALGGADFSEAYNANIDRVRGAQDAFYADSPIASNIATGLGWFTSPTPQLVSKAKGFVDTAKAAVKEGAILGGLFGAGAGEDGLVNRVEDAGQTALAMSVFSPLAVGTIQGASKLLGLPSKIMSVFSPTAQTETAKDAARKIVGEIVDAEATAGRLRQFQERPPTEFSPFMRTAEVTGAPELAALEQAARKGMGIDAEIQASDAARELARKELFKRFAPDEISPEIAGGAIREGLEEGLSRSKSNVEKFAEKAFLGGEDLRTFPAKKAVSDALNQFTKTGARQVTPEFQTLVDNFRALPKNVDLQVLQDFRSAFGKFAGSGGVGATPVQKMTAEIAGRMRQAVDDSVQRAVEAGELPKGQANAWRKMIDASRTQKETFESGVVGNILKKRGTTYKIEGSEVANKALQTPEDARALLKALGPWKPGKQALQSSLLQNVWERSTNPITQEFNATSFARQLRLINGVDKEVLTPKQLTALQKIGQDLESQTSVARKAYGASKGQSITAQATTVLEQLQNAVKEESLKSVSAISPKLGLILKVMRGVVNDPKAQAQLINQELAKFVLSPANAEALLARPLSRARPGALLDTFARSLQGVVLPLVAAKKAQIASTSAPWLDERTSTTSRTNARTQTQPVAIEAPSFVKPTPEVPQRQVRNSPSVFDTYTAERVADAIRNIESSNGKNLIGPMTKAGRALGPYQFTAATAKDYGVSDRFDEAESRAGALKKLRNDFNVLGDLDLTIAAYNRGLQGVINDMKRSGASSWDELAPFMNEETRNYVPKVRGVFEQLMSNQNG